MWGMTPISRNGISNTWLPSGTGSLALELIALF